VYYTSVYLHKTGLRTGPLKQLDMMMMINPAYFYSLTVCPEEGVPLLTRKPLTLSGEMGYGHCNLTPNRKQKSECSNAEHFPIK